MILFGVGLKIDALLSKEHLDSSSQSTFFLNQIFLIQVQSSGQDGRRPKTVAFPGKYIYLQIHVLP